MSVNITDLTADPLNQTDPFRSNSGLFQFTGLPTGANWNVSGSAVDSANNTLSFSSDSFSLPKESSGIIELSHGTEKRKFVGNTTYDDLTFTFKALMGHDSYGLLKAWRALVHNPENGKTYVADKYKKNGVLVVYGPAPVSGDAHTCMIFNLFGAWPTNLDAGEIDKTGEDYIRCNLTLAIDKFTYAYNGSTVTAPVWPNYP